MATTAQAPVPTTPAKSGAKIHKDLRAAFAVNGQANNNLQRSIFIGYIIAGVIFWLASPSKVLPSPLDVLGAFPHLWNEGLGVELMTSLRLNLHAIALTVLISLFVAYSTAIPALRPVATFFSTFRFNGFVGLPLLLTFLIGDQHWIKVSLLVIAMSVFTIPAIVAAIEAIPQEAYDHGRVLRMSEWRVLWEVVIVGRFHEVIDIILTNIAIGWTMLPMVEGIFRAEGGIGVMILTENKYFKLESVYAIIITMMVVGLGIDFIGRTIKRIICPYAFINTERK